jgi:hypothetical protein
VIATIQQQPHTSSVVFAYADLGWYGYVDGGGFLYGEVALNG